MTDKDQAFYRRPVWLLTGMDWLPAWGDDDLEDFVVLRGKYECYECPALPLGHGSLRPRDPNDAGQGDRPDLGGGQ